MAKKALVEQIDSNNKTLRVDGETGDDHVAETRAFCERMSNEKLIEYHGIVTQVINSNLKEVEVIEQVLAARFPCEQTYELLTTKHGVAERKVRNSYVPKPEKMENLWVYLGPDYSTYIDEKAEYNIDPHKVSDLMTLIEKQGGEPRDYLIINRKYAATKKAVNEIKDGSKIGKTLSRVFDVIQKVTVKVRPVNEGAKK